MKTYDWIVVGGGITGTALAYELSQAGLAVLLLDSDATLQGATRYSYGSLAYWSGTCDLTKALCREGIERHRHLSTELDYDTQFRELDLVLTIATDQNPETLAAAYANCAIPPQLVSVKDACQLEPLLNPHAIAGALTVPVGHVHPEQITQGYRQAFYRAGGKQEIAQVVELLRQGDRIQGVKTANHQTYYAPYTVVCAGGLSRALLNQAGFKVRVYFTHTEIIETPTVDLKLRTLVMPANIQRFQLEAQASRPELEHLWDEPGYELVPPILDAGAIQFLDGTVRMGQMSRVLTQPFTSINSIASETAIRTQMEIILPTLAKLPGTWHHCLVAFSPNHLPVVGALEHLNGLYIFSGFTYPMVFVPPVAQHFAQWVIGNPDEIMTQFSKNFQERCIPPLN